MAEADHKPTNTNNAALFSKPTNTNNNRYPVLCAHVLSQLNRVVLVYPDVYPDVSRVYRVVF